MDAPREDPIARIMDLSLGYCRAQGLGTVSRLGIADMLEEGPRPVSELAAEAGADEDALYRLLRALTVEGIFEEREGRTFYLFPGLRERKVVRRCAYCGNEYSVREPLHKCPNCGGTLEIVKK